MFNKINIKQFFVNIINMNEDERKYLHKYMTENKVEDTTEKIRATKQSDKLKNDVVKLLSLRRNIRNTDRFRQQCERQCSYLKTHQKKLYEKLLDTKNISTVAEFLSTNPGLRHIVRRVFIVEKFPYSEIQDNTIGKNIMPIDMLRLKLSFFGALKFDPRSDKWLRICMFQGAPLPDELKNYDEQWVYRTSI